MKRFINPAVLMQVGFNLLTVLIMVSLLYFTGALASPASTPAVPGVLPYQGTLVNSQGNPVEGLFNMTFFIYPEPEGGTALWTEAHAGGNGVPVAQGLFNVNLGSLVPIPTDIWDQAPLFLGVQVGTDSEMLPRLQIGGVPAAMQASVAQLALTVPDSSITSAKAALTHGEIYGSGEVLTMTNTPKRSQA